MEVVDKVKNFFYRYEIELLGYCKDIEFNDKQLENIEFNKLNLEMVNISVF